MFPVDIAIFLRIVFLYNTSCGCFWQSYHGTVKSARVPVLWFHSSTCFWFWSETFTKCCTDNSLLSHNKTISSLHELVLCFWFQNMFWKNIDCFQFWWKLKALHKYLCNIRHQKTFFPCFLWAGAFNSTVWFGKWKNAV